MKAITCSQCGALITKFSKIDNFADCDYCSARIRIKEKKIHEVSDDKKKVEEKSLDSYQRYLKRKKEIEEKSKRNQWLYSTDSNTDWIGIVFAALMIILAIYALIFW